MRAEALLVPLLKEMVLFKFKKPGLFVAKARLFLNPKARILFRFLQYPFCCLTTCFEFVFNLHLHISV
jgi:hypothetical protein